MSANPINANDIIQYLGNLLNIDVTGKLTVMDMIDDLSSIQDLAAFRIFVKEKFNYERFRFLTGYQKFNALVNEFKKENKPTLDDEMISKANSYSSELFLKLTNILDEVNFELQTKGKTIEDLNFMQTLSRNGFAKHQINVISQLGSKKELMNLCLYGKEILRLRIEDIVNRKALIKQYPQLAPKKDEAAINLIQNLTNRTRITQ